ncbi:transposase, partial [Methanolobus halotolerans]
MATERWKHSNTTVYNIGFHLIWCSKYRRNVLENEIEARLKEL